VRRTGGRRAAETLTTAFFIAVRLALVLGAIFFGAAFFAAAFATALRTGAAFVAAFDFAFAFGADEVREDFFGAAFLTPPFRPRTVLAITLPFPIEPVFDQIIRELSSELLLSNR
jgi:hypothetical protein